MTAARLAGIAGIALGVALDAALGDPEHHHPVAGLGILASRLETVLHRDSRLAGAAHQTLVVGGVLGLGVALETGTRWTARRHGPVAGALLRTATTAVVVWTCLGGRSLAREAERVHERLVAGDLDGARRQVGRLVGRRTAELDADEVARACVESVAENAADAVVATLVCTAVGGAPAALVHRAANTLDAMVGHRTPRHARFGWAAARTDDVLGWLPARVTVAATALLAGPRAPVVLRTVRRDAPAHPSPNAGPVEAAAAAALGVRLGGRNDYEGDVQDRGVLGDGRPVTADDIPRAVALLRRTTLVTLGGAVVATLARDLLRRPARRRR